MKIFRISWIIASLAILTGRSIAAEEDERAQWISERWKVIENAKATRDENAFDKLGDIVRPLGRDLPQLKSDTRELYDEARRTLLSTPGYADYFGNRIKRITDAEIGGIPVPDSERRGWDFETLAHLQSPDTVRVLGESLFDERNPFKDSSLDAPWRSTCMYAEVALFKLDLSNPPVPGPIPDYEKDLHTWQLWYQQVRAGTRTFSFKGDDKVYTLAGPVTEPKEPGASTTKSAPSVAPQATAEAPQRPKWPLIVAVVAAAAVLFVVIKKAKRRAPAP
ncbi:MAG: hypothetical protein JWO82_1192 [Akkermansiaceae bacterium]|nr:hypothetical protein [Akkermansiaceae bacterium]